MNTKIFLIFALVLFPFLNATASEIRIKDTNGLIRFSKPSAVAVDLQITLGKGPQAKELLLEQEDSMKDPLRGELIDKRTFEVKSVIPGRYIILLRPAGAKIRVINTK